MLGWDVRSLRRSCEASKLDWHQDWGEWRSHILQLDFKSNVGLYQEVVLYLSKKIKKQKLKIKDSESRRMRRMEEPTSAARFQIKCWIVLYLSKNPDLGLTPRNWKRNLLQTFEFKFKNIDAQGTPWVCSEECNSLVSLTPGWLWGQLWWTIKDQGSRFKIQGSKMFASANFWTN